MGLIGEVLGWFLWDKMTDRLTEWIANWSDGDESVVPGALRVLEGRLPGLTDRWDRKDVRLGSGRLRYRRWHLRAVTVVVTSVERLDDRVVRLESESAVLELAVWPDWMEQVQRHLSPEQ